MAEVGVVMDLRRLSTTPSSAAEMLDLWARVERDLHGRSLRGATAHAVAVPGAGWCDLLLVDPAAAPALVTSDVRFAVHAVIETPEVRSRCSTCQQRGEVSYAPFGCDGCGADAGRVCDRHAVILAGSFRARCPAHAPVCGCGTPATYWCRGPRCRGAVAHCGRHRSQHPGDPDVGYCPDCYAQRYPSCAHRGCPSTGGIACEHVDPATQRLCGVRACARHAQRWQVFGPQKRGLGRCPTHASGLSTLTAQQIVYQIVAGTAARLGEGRGRRSDPPPRLPRLSVVRHIFINVHGTALDMAVVDGLFDAVRRGLGLSTADQAMGRLLERHEAIRAQDVEGFRQEHRLGREHFGRLQTALRQRGRHDLAERVTFADFRPKANLLFVRVPPELVGRFKGRQSAEVRALSDALGVIVKVEEK